MSHDPSKKPPGLRKEGGDPFADAPQDEPGRVAEDDRGNMTWQWSNNEVLQADNTAGAVERLRALVDPNLDVVDEDPPHSLQHNPKGLKVGYNPYNSGALGKTERKKKMNLRELSKWIQTKRKVEQSGGSEK